MSDEAQQVAPEAQEAQAQDGAAVQAQPDEPGKQAERVYTKAEVEALVRDRLAGAKRTAEEQAKKAAAEAEAKALAEQGRYKELFEKQQAELDAERQRAKALELAALKRDIAAEVGLPAALAARLQGEDAEALKADAQALIAAMPKPTAPNLNSAQGANGAPSNTKFGGLSEQEFASIFGVNPKYVSQ